MKKLLWIVVLGLLLSGCFQDKTKIALENCADAKYKRTYLSETKILFKNDKEIQSINERISQNKEKKEKLKKDILTYTKLNLVDNSYFTNKYFGNVYMFVLGFDLDEDKIKIKPEYLKYKPGVINKDRIKDNITKLTYSYLTSSQEERTLSTMLGMNVTPKWQKLKVSKKMQSKFYARKHKNCELEYNKIPNSFLAQWGK
jgi:hypothetical protein